jgi:SH3-like domain-containing protein
MNRILLTLSVAMVCLGCGSPTEKPKTPPKPKPGGTSALPAMPALQTAAITESLQPPTTAIPVAVVKAMPAPVPTEAAEKTEVATRPEIDPVGAAAPGPAPAAAEPAGEAEVPLPEPKTGTVNARTLNVRVSASTDKRLITTFKRGRQIKVVARKGKWLKIELPTDITLWVMSRFITIPEGQDMPATGTVNANRVRLRAAGDLKSPILRELTRDSQLEVTDRAGDWFKVRAPAGTHAWVHGNYIKFDTAIVAVDPPVVDPKVVDPKVVDPKVVDPKVVDPKTVEPKLITGKGVQQFSEAEAAYRQARAEKNPDLVKIFLMYYDVSKIPGVSKAVKDTCEGRMAEIARRIPSAQRKRIEAQVESLVTARLRAIDAAAKAAKEQLPKVAPKYTAVGYLDKAPDVAGIPGTHKLTLSGVLLYYLRAAGDDVDVGKFTGRKVGVMGRKRYVKGWGIQVIEVSEIRPYKRPPSTSSWVDHKGK